MWPFFRKRRSGFSSSSTAEEVTQGIDGNCLTAIITGASSGIGTETAQVLALRGVHVVMAVRNVSSGNAVKEAIVKEIPTVRIDVMELDLSSMASVRKFALEFDALNLPLNILMLTYWDGIRFDKINNQALYQSYLAYGQSKLANILHANELARRLKEEGANVTANSLHPGLIMTNLFHYQNSIINAAFGAVAKLATKTVQQGAATTCYLAMNPELKGVTGKYFKDSNVCTPSSKALDQALAKKLWDFSMNIIQA